MKRPETVTSAIILHNCKLYNLLSPKIPHFYRYEEVRSQQSIMNRTGGVDEAGCQVDEYSPSKTTAQHSSENPEVVTSSHSNNAPKPISAGMVSSVKRSGK
jgi:hypothetical protein